MDFRNLYSNKAFSLNPKRIFYLTGLFFAILLYCNGAAKAFAGDIETNDPSPWVVAYFSRIQMEVEKVWLYPSSSVERKEAGQATVRLVISKDGKLLDVRIEKSSSYKELDEAAKTAVSKAAPFDPFPPSMKLDTVSIKMNFSYLPQ